MNRLLLLFLYTCASIAAIAQTNNDLRCVGDDEGLAGDCVYAILKDSRGLTWVGTNRGISLYDGQHATTIPCEVRRSQNLVHDLAELPDGSIVAAMRAGVCQLKIEYGKWTMKIPVTDARSLLLLGDTLLVGSAEGLMMVQPGRSGQWSKENEPWQVTPLTLGSSRIARDNQIIDLCADGSGGAWVISASALYHLDTTMKARRQDIDFGAVRDGLRCVCAVNGQVYVGTSWQGLLRYNPVQHTINEVDAVAEGVVADVKTDGAGNLFVALDGGGAVELDTRGDSIVHRLTTSNAPLPTNAVYTFWREPQTGLAFFGFYRYGMAHTLYSHPLVDTYRFGSFDSRKHNVRSFCIHDPWKAIGTREGLWLINEQSGDIRHFGHEEMGGTNVLSIAWFADCFVVATFDGGLCYIDPQTQSATRPNEEVLRKGNFTKVGPTPKSSLMAISNHVIILDPSMRIRAQYDSHNSELTGAVLTDFLIDGTHKAWISGTDGIALYDPANGVVQRTGFPDGFFNREISATFALDTNGDVLAVSENGLYRCRPDLSAWDSLDIASRLDVGTISFIAPQHAGYWVGTDRGLFLMDSLFHRFRHIGLSEGLTSLFCNPQSWQVDADGHFWFSTWEGLHKLSALKTSVLSAKSLFPSISVDGRSLPLSDCISISTKNATLSVGWNFGQEALEIEVMALDYADGRGRYVEWSVDDGPVRVATERRPIRIDGLWLGRHRLHIYRPGEQQPQTYTFSVWPNAAFWFEMAFALLVIISIPLLMQYQRRVSRLRTLRRRKRAIEKEHYAREAVERHIQEEQQQRREAEEARRATMYQRSRSSLEEYRRLLRELKRLMDDEHPYRRDDLRVADVARALHTTPNKLSQMLSQHAGVTFYDFINDYRIEEFKRRALDEKFAHLSTLAIAEKCGFKKTTFYSAFAKKEGCTPAEWLARHRPSKHSEPSSKFT